MLIRSASILRKVGFYNHSSTRPIINTAGAINYLYPDVLLLFCHPLEERAVEREDNVLGKLSKLRKTDSQEKKDQAYRTVANIILEISSLSPWEISRCNLIKEYINDCEQKK